MTAKKTKKHVPMISKRPIAVVGMASIFPNAKDLSSYWDVILNELDCITDVPPSRWDIDAYYDPDASKPDKTYCKRGGFIPDIDFNPMDFGLPPNILEVTDVSQLLALVVAQEALKDAGYIDADDDSLNRTGVVLGMVGMSSKLFSPLMSRLQYPVWEKVLKNQGLSDEDTQMIIEKIKLAYVGWNENAFPGAIGNVVAGRIANRFNLGGTNCVVDAACGSSLAAVKMAVTELVDGHADMMITGGVDTDNSITSYLCFSKTPAFSKGERVRTFDTESDGMMVGEGLGMLVLKRLEDAERDKDNIYAVIKGVGSSSDGRAKSIYAPRAEGQAKAIRRAYEQAGFTTDTVSLIEAHGTGTPAGDPAEIDGLKEVFGGKNGSRHVAVGSVKSQIGHTKAAAGAASLIKTSLALHHKVLPATINVNTPSPKLDIENSPLYINSETRPWFRLNESTPRRAGVSSFGFGGTNFHIAMEEYKNDHTEAYRIQHVPQTFMFSAPGLDDLIKTCRDALPGFDGENTQDHFDQLAQASQSTTIPNDHARIGFVAADVNEAKDLLQQSIKLLESKPNSEQLEHPRGIYYRKNGLETVGKVVALFPGQGSQYVNMGKSLAINFPTIREVFSKANTILQSDGSQPLTDKVFPIPVFDPVEEGIQKETLKNTENSQPAIGVLSIAIYNLLCQAGFKPDFTAGHSFGELTALCASEVVSEEDFIKLTIARGRAMAASDDPEFDAGTMLAVKGDYQKILEEVKDNPDVTVANLNSPTQIVLAGPKDAIEAVKDALAEKGYTVIPLPVSAAFHTKLVGHAQKPFAEFVKKIKFNKPNIRLFSNSTGKEYANDVDEIKQALSNQMLQSVLFKDEIENIYDQGGTIFVEIGPKNVLTALVKDILKDKPHFAVALNANAKKDSDRQLRDAVLQLRIAGLKINNIDPYQLVHAGQSSPQASKVSVTLNGGLYVSDKTRNAFTEALEDKTPLKSLAAPLSGSNGSEKTNGNGHKNNGHGQDITANNQPATGEPNTQASSTHTVQMQPQFNSAFNQHLEELQSLQNEAIHVHEQYLKNDSEFRRIISELAQMSVTQVSNAQKNGNIDNSTLRVLDSYEHTMEKMHGHQNGTAHIHEIYLNEQMEFNRNFSSLLQNQVETISNQAVLEIPVAVPPSIRETAGSSQSIKAAPVYEEPQDAPGHDTPATGQVPAAGVDVEAIKSGLLEIVADKTGYPVEMLELDMNMEADLGIDSIKRVEILSGVQERFPALPKISPEALTDLQTLGQIIEHLEAQAPVTVNTAAEPVKDTGTSPASSGGEQAAAISTATIDSQVISTKFLEIVADKTGYPTEMLELDMDMEADLGIDSIKRVEILGAMQEQFPELPQIKPEELGSLQTLGQIINRLGSQSAAAAASASVETNVPTQAHEVQANQSEPVNSDTLNVEQITAAILEIVADKTGYPAEMLELDMDMEADLGIDSIKRVEILGAVQEKFPELPTINPEKLSGMQTLGNIIDQLGSTASQAVSASPAEGEVSAKETDSDALFRGSVILKELSAADRLDFSPAENHVCLITDDGTDHTLQLINKLSDKNWKVFVLRFPESIVSNNAAIPTDVESVLLNNMGEKHLQDKLNMIMDKNPIGAFIHLNSENNAGKENEVNFSEVQKKILQHVFLIAKYLKPSLTNAAKDNRSVFMTVTRIDGNFGLENNKNADALSGGLNGLVKTLNLEWNDVFCRAVDITPDLPAEIAAEHIMAEIYDANNLITEVGYTPKSRVTLTLSD